MVGVGWVMGVGWVVGQAASWRRVIPFNRTVWSIYESKKC